MFKFKKGYSFVELLVSLFVIGIIFAIMSIIVNLNINAYKTTKLTLQNVYADSYVSFLFDVLEGEVKWIGSGREFLANLYRPTFVPNSPSSYNPMGAIYSEISNKVRWFGNYFDYERTGGKDIMYLNYVIAYPVTLKRNTDGTYSPISAGYMGPSGWSIIRGSLSKNSPNYFARYAKLRFYKNGVVFSGGYLTPNDKLTVKEINLALQNTSTDINLRAQDLFITPIARFKKAVFNNGYITRSFRQIRIIYDPNARTIVMEKFMPALDLTQQVFPTILLDNVNSFSTYILYRDMMGQDKEVEIYRAKYSPPSDFTPDAAYAIKFVVEWESPWRLFGNTNKITKTRIISLVK